MCIFCNIVNKELDASIVYENKNIMAFLDNDPINEGHILLIPKKHYLDVDELPIELLNELMEISQKLVKAIKKYIIQMDIVLCKMVENLMILVIIIYTYSQDIKVTVFI